MARAGEAEHDIGGRQEERSRRRAPHGWGSQSIAHAMGRTEINYFGDRDLTGRAEYQGPLAPLMA